MLEEPPLTVRMQRTGWSSGSRRNAAFLEDWVGMSRLVDQQGGSRRCQFFTFGVAHLGVTQFERLQCIHDHLGDNQAGEPFMVRGDDMPWRIISGGISDHVFVRPLVTTP